LHFGSLLAACASYLQAKSAGGKWLLRIEDIDPPREQPGADHEIVAILEAFGFEWDGPVSYQSANAARHIQLIERLRLDRLAYPCSCSRKDLAGVPRGPLGAIYPGTCRNGNRSRKRVAIRVLTNSQPVAFDDGLQGHQMQRLEVESGDFVIKRRDGLIAYHLAVVADDEQQKVTEVVRGIDLMDSTPRQLYLQALLGFAAPRYLHIPVIKNDAGQKLSKQTGAPALQADLATQTLAAALDALGQMPPQDLASGRLCDIWDWAIQNWDINRLVSQTAIPWSKYALAAARNGLS